MGWSLGGLIALTAALDLPDQVTSVVAMCSTPRFVRTEGWPYGNDAAMVEKLADDLETDYHGTLELFIAL